jgi:outer membrane lipoprotein carrier protein
VKKLIISSILSVFAIAVIAQNAETPDAKATGILQNVSKKTKTYKTINAEFTITQYGKDKKPGDSQKGILWSKGAKYKLDIKNQLVFCDSITKWTYLKDANEVQINKVDASAEEGGGLSPSTIFSFYDKGFKSRFVDEEKVNNVLCECIDLYPKHPEKEKYHTLRLFIDKVKNQLVQITVLMKDGTTQVISVDKFVPNTALSDASFTFDKSKYPGVEIEDLRE